MSYQHILVWSMLDYWPSFWLPSMLHCFFNTSSHFLHRPVCSCIMRGLEEKVLNIAELNISWSNYIPIHVECMNAVMIVSMWVAYSPCRMHEHCVMIVSMWVAYSPCRMHEHCVMIVSMWVAYSPLKKKHSPNLFSGVGKEICSYGVIELGELVGLTDYTLPTPTIIGTSHHRTPL